MTDALVPAATILLLRDAPAFEVLMIERHADISFAGGALVFPGGKVDAGDADDRWADHCDGLASAPPEERAPRIAAIREAFEETGVLLARDADGAMASDDAVAALDHWRGAVEAESARFLDMIAGAGLRLTCDALRLFARWQPPEGVTPRRYHTWFFAAAAPADQQAREDGNEATEALWTTPQAALDARASGARKMIFPTLRNMELLNRSVSAQGVFDYAAERVITPVEPAVVKRDGKVFLSIPDGLGYPVTEEPLETAHRA